MSAPDPHTCEVTGLKYYAEIPEGFRLATMEDVRKHCFKNNTAYLGKGLDGRYYCKRISGVLPQGLIPFVELHRVYIWAGSSRTGDSHGVDK